MMYPECLYRIKMVVLKQKYFTPIFSLRKLIQEEREALINCKGTQYVLKNNVNSKHYNCINNNILLLLLYTALLKLSFLKIVY